MSNNFAKPLQDATNEELLLWINTMDPNYAKLASDELTRRNLKTLHETMDVGIIQSQKSSEIQERLTKVLFILTVVQLLVALFQLLLSFAYSDNIQEKLLGVFMVIAAVSILYLFGKRIFS